MDAGNKKGIEDAGSLAGAYASRTAAPSFDMLRPWKIISPNNIYIIWLSVLLFAFYAFARHGVNWIALSTSLIASVPVGFAIAFFETQSQEFRRRHRRTKFWFYLLYRTFRVVVWFMVLFFFIMVSRFYKFLQIPLLGLTLVVLYLITMYTDNRKPFEKC